ncbi:site-specific integrase [Psychrosphaera aestuarii]|uniref:hypothetical protein n=1 Tax=Psychrosphaera aestuarii TaxID=1266052 RepID=UPI001B3440C2|nr:hypothetical protein [Psychrosphaera aestuarii]
MIMKNATLAHMKRQQKSLVCDYNRLNTFDVETFLQHTVGTTCMVKNLLIASLCVGERIENLLSSLHQIKLSHVHNCGVKIKVLEFPRYENFHDEMPLAFLESEGQPFAILPFDVASILKGIDVKSLDIEFVVKQADNYLASLNQKFDTKLTAVRLARHLSHVGAKFDLSCAELDWLTESELGRHSGAYYLQINAADLKAKLFRYVQTQYEAAGLSANFNYTAPHDTQSKRIGSNLYVRNEHIKDKSLELVATIETLKSSPIINIEELHNHYTYFTLQLLNLATGHRPGEGQYNTLQNFDVDSGYVLVQDKRSRGPGTCRLIPLSNIAIKQITLYIEHLSSLQKWCELDGSDVVADIANTLKFNAPVFRFMRHGKLISATSSQYAAYVPMADKNKSNWNRHWLRTQLADQLSILEPAVNAFMGHEDKLDETYSKFSSLSLAHIKAIALFLEESLKNLGFKPLRGLCACSSKKVIE